MWIPPGFAHGFLALSDVADFQYKCSDVYHPPGERTIRWDDPTIGIDWPVIEGRGIVLSDKDANHAVSFSEAETFA